LKLEESIAEDQLLLKKTINEKKVAWNKFQNERTDELRQEHKQLVQNEKILKVKINELIAEIRNMDNILQEFNLGNYAPVHL
jgi:transcription initiation factor TFIID subunit TAF12